MSAKGYTTTGLVSEELGLAFDVMQELQVAGLIEAAEGVIDGLTARQWLTPADVSAEPHTPIDAVVQLLVYPVNTINAVSARTYAVGDLAETLVDGRDYELIDPASGVLLVPGRVGQLVSVSYNATAALPSTIQRAATLLVRHWMLPRLLGVSAGTLDTVSIADVSVKYQAASVAGRVSDDVPDEVLALLGQARKPIFV